ncbi:hypothetical protein IQ249_24715 [Lusitaniella coriacea LEGE 07157]|uniref:Uncharacterized protein n=1 Tax=Lusitaniella coriacea LEGE 07157 TaxID=945747 RepID=A0A8J7E0U2_9CYAN|nr:hypothetical protein [Lusitaniella coriacea]MBE9119063.1 hypothetical protein [Lusitaniella coriacea LEGE 07157]
MSNFDIDSLVAVAGFGIGIFTSMGGVLVAYMRNRAYREKKEYAAERDFQHLKRNYLSLSEGMTSTQDEIDRQFRELQRNNDDKFQQLNYTLLEIKGAIERLKN